MELAVIKQAQQNLEMPLNQHLIRQESNKLSIYAKGKPLTMHSAMKISERIAIGFPELNKGFYVLLAERLIANGFTEERFIASVNHVIDTFHYGKLPNIAEFISFDKEIQAFTYEQILEKLKDDKLAFEKHTLVNLNGLKRYVRNEDKENYKLNKWSTQ
ncbi:MAG TPA: hypothetical protein VFF33_02960 [Ignavibacteriaceae bacterium]|nr:hypothetical protein [Ignavibacteriaceae bacterium]